MFISAEYCAIVEVQVGCHICIPSNTQNIYQNFGTNPLSSRSIEHIIIICNLSIVFTQYSEDKIKKILNCLQLSNHHRTENVELYNHICLKTNKPRKGTRRCRDGLTVSSTSHSYRASEFGSYHLQGNSGLCNTSLKGSNTLFWLSGHHAEAWYTCMHVGEIQAHHINLSKSLKKLALQSYYPKC